MSVAGGYPIPRHLSEVLRRNPAKSGDTRLVGDVVCACGSRSFAVLYVGYPGVRDYGSRTPVLQTTEFGGRYFFRIAARCDGCAKEHLLFDMHLHGWNGFLCGEEADRKARPPAYAKWRCDCGGASHRIEIDILAEDKQISVEESGGELTDDSWFEGFAWLTLSTVCDACKLERHALVDYETM
ncbi:hypothetical protein [Terricaulis sp.]|uniref:hypothetical protein n=1 Tax=Terricaulis sp. TaxID=2768686 RepID=UPI003784691A